MSARLLRTLAYRSKADQRVNVSEVLSFHTTTSYIRRACVPVLIYSSVVHFSMQHGKPGRGRATRLARVRLRLIPLEMTILHENSTSDQQFRYAIVKQKATCIRLFT